MNWALLTICAFAALGCATAGPVLVPQARKLPQAKLDSAMTALEQNRIDAQLALSKCQHRFDGVEGPKRVAELLGCYADPDGGLGQPRIVLTNEPFVDPRHQHPSDVCFAETTDGLVEVDCPLRGTRGEYQFRSRGALPPFSSDSRRQFWTLAGGGVLLVWSTGYEGGTMCLESSGDQLVGHYVTFTDYSKFEFIAAVKLAKVECNAGEAK